VRAKATGGGDIALSNLWIFSFWLFRFQTCWRFCRTERMLS